MEEAYNPIVNVSQNINDTWVNVQSINWKACVQESGKPLYSF